jgi:ribonucleoside-diphosphate reductase alpha chain
MNHPISETARTILEQRYLNRDPDGELAETPRDMFWRVARAIASAETLFDDKAKTEPVAEHFFELMYKGLFLPNSPTLMNAGTDMGQLAACFVLPVEDRMESIFDTLKQAALIHKSGGGTGFSFSRLRPSGDTVRTTSGAAGGPVAFINAFDSATEAINQGGRRRGANMAVLHVNHPDIEAFIAAKTVPGQLANFNLSVSVSNTFMQAVAADQPFDLVSPRSGQAVAQRQAGVLFDQITEAAWRNGEPGLIFIDRVNQSNPTPAAGVIEATNPCGEQPLLPYESCTLGSVNLAAMVADGEIDWERLRRTIYSAIHFLDNVIEINRYPLEQIDQASKATRKIGLGVMGFADMLIKYGQPYDSEAAVKMAEETMAFVQREARSASARLAQTRGNFPLYPGSLFDRLETPHMRNATVTTIAPTGTISLIAGVSSGIEPLYAIAVQRRVLDGNTFFDLHPLFIEMARNDGIDTEQLAETLSAAGSTAIEQIPQHLRHLFVTAHEVAPEWHVRMQAAFQRSTDNAVSKTVNFPATATADQVGAAFKLAYEQGCKGITVYRDGSREQQVLSAVRPQNEDQAPLAPRPRPERTQGVTERIRTGCGKLYVTVNSDEEGLCEVFAKMGKTGGCASSQIEAAGRLISLALRAGISTEVIIKQLKGIRCPSPIWENGKIVLSCPDAMAQVLLSTTGTELPEPQGMQGVCPDCGGTLAHAEGCLVCHGCGFSKCG